MRILVVHNQLWAHYKSKLFDEIHANLRIRYPDAVFHVVQIGLYESGRQNMQPTEADLYDYPYEVLFQKSLDQIGLTERIKALFKAYSRFRPTVLNITGYYDWAQILLMGYARATGVKVVLSSESSSLDHTRSKVKEMIKSWIINRASAFFCFGKTSVDYLQKLGVPREKITVTNAAVIDDERIRERYLQTKKGHGNHPEQFIFVGRFSEEKNLLTLLKAYQNAIKSEAPPWGLTLVGDGPQRKEIETFIIRENLEMVTLTGGVSWLEVPEWLAKSDVLILPSYSEPWGLAVNEALVCGLPVLVSEKCGCVEDLVVPEQNGFSFDPYDDVELTRLMIHFMNSTREVRDNYGTQGRKIVSRFAASKVAGEMTDTFASLSENTIK